MKNARSVMATAKEERAPTHDPGAKRRRVGDLTSLKQQQLTRDPRRASLDVSPGLCDDAQCANPLAVQSCILGVRLAHEHGHVLLDEMANGPGIVVKISRGKALHIAIQEVNTKTKRQKQPDSTHLVRAIKERKVTLRKEDRGNLLPLLPSGIHTRRVVGARVKEEDGLRRGRTEEGEEGGESETDGCGVVVGVVLRRAADVGEDGLVVSCGVGYRKFPSEGGVRSGEPTPRRIADVDDLVCLGLARPGTIESLEERCSIMVRPSSRDRLNAERCFNKEASSSQLPRHLDPTAPNASDPVRAYVLTRPSLIAGLSSPKMSLPVAEVKAGSPAMGRYSWSSVSLLAIRILAYGRIKQASVRVHCAW
jgi:hypothetical protein